MDASATNSTAAAKNMLLFASFEERVLRRANDAGTPVYLVFSSLLPSVDLQRRLKELHVHSPAFIAGEPLRGVEADTSS